MEQSHPPYVAGATSIPRTLLRWLDVNPQNGPLSRNQTTITLPAFTGNNETWLGVSDIITAFNFESPNNFSLHTIVGVANPNYTLCISYHIGGVMTRYIIWLASGSVMNQDIPMYNGQPVKKNFRFEVWSSSQGNATQVSAITMYTSVAGSQDYRWGLDAALVGNDGQVGSFGNVASIVPSIIGNLYYQWNNTTLVNSSDAETNWFDSYHIDTQQNLAGTYYATTSGIYGQVVIYSFVNDYVTNSKTITSPTKQFVIVCWLGTQAGNIISLSNSASVGVFLLASNGDGTYNVNGALVPQLTANKWLVITGTFNKIAIYTLGFPRPVVDADYIDITAGVASTISNVTLLDSGNTTLSQIQEFSLWKNGASSLIANSTLQNYIDYLNIVYARAYTLPLTFPSNSASLTN